MHKVAPSPLLLLLHSGANRDYHRKMTAADLQECFQDLNYSIVCVEACICSCLHLCVHVFEVPLVGRL